MSAVLHLFFGFRGRIGRKGWWLGNLVMMTLGLVVLALKLSADGFDPTNPPKLTSVEMLIGHALYVPFAALTVKRLNDRDHAAWLGIAWLAMVVGASVAPYLGWLAAEPDQWTKTEMATFFAVGLFSLWVFIDNGFLEGTQGPNRHGPDPRAASPASDVASPPPTRRTAGANIRDGLVALTGLFVLFCFSVAWLGSNLPRLVSSAFTPEILQIYNEQKANAPAFKAESDGRAAGRAGKREEAIEHFTRAIKLYGVDHRTAANAYRSRGWELRWTGKPEQALSDYNRAVALEPNNALGIKGRAAVLAELGRHAEALADYDATLAKRPDDPGVYIGRGQALERLDRREEALAAYIAAVPAAEREFDDSIKLRVKYEEDKSEEALWRVRLRRDRDGAIARAHFRRANVLRDLGRRPDALKAYDDAIGRWPDYRSAYLNRGWVYEKSDNRELARADYEKAATLGKPDEWLTRALERTR